MNWNAAATCMFCGRLSTMHHRLSPMPNNACFQIIIIIQSLGMGTCYDLSSFMFALRLPGLRRHSLHGVILTFGRSATSVRCAPQCAAPQ